MNHAQNVKEVLAISPAAVTNGATSVAAIDTLGADYVTVRTVLGSIATPGTGSADGVTIKLRESTDTNASNATTIVSDVTGMKNGGVVVHHVDTKTRKRYLILSAIPGTSGVSNEPVTVSAIATLSRLEVGPAGTAAMTATTNDSIKIV